MLQRTLKIIVVLFIFFRPFVVGAQNIFQRPKTMQQLIGRMNDEQNKWTYRYAPAFVKNTAFKISLASYSPLLRMPAPERGTSRISPGSPVGFHLSPKFYALSSGFFCRQEWKVQKFTSIPFHFRLGSLEYVNFLEQKPNALKPK